MHAIPGGTTAHNFDAFVCPISEPKEFLGVLDLCGTVEGKAPGPDGVEWQGHKEAQVCNEDYTAYHCCQDL